jgi:alkylated DNA nucleotide flippase Atl1
LASGYTTGGREAHKRDLEAEGVEVRDDYTVDVEKLLWWPPESSEG